jgi:hypothetical protein
MTYSICSVNLNKCSECSASMSPFPSNQLRSHVGVSQILDKLVGSNNDCRSCEFIWSVSLRRWSLIRNVRSYYVGHIKLDAWGHNCNTGR